MTKIRQPVVAGSFYPGDATRLRNVVEGFLAVAGSADGPAPKAIIVPHAGYIYSGPIAASAYARLVEVKSMVKRVILLGPAHRFPVPGLAVSSDDAFATPLGLVPVDKQTVAELLTLPQVQLIDEAHRFEHGLEVHLPFLQTILSDFKMVPLVVGDASTATVADVLAAVWGGPETLIVVSSDLSHYLDYEMARRRDRATAKGIESLQPQKLDRESACGRAAIKGLLHLAARHGLRARTVDLRSSGDTAGPKDRVVGYGAFVLS